jgi:hypothetical protein
MRWHVLAAIAFCALIASVGVLYRAMSGPIRLFTNVASSAPVSTASSAEADFGSHSPIGTPAFPASHPSAKPPVPAAGPEPMRAPPQRNTEVDDLATKLAPAFAREAVDLSAQKSPVMPEVEHELLETWKEQKQILAGKRDTIDTVLHEAQ